MKLFRPQFDRLQDRYLKLDLRGKITVQLLLVAATMGILILAVLYFAAKYQITTQTESILQGRARIEKREIELRLGGLIGAAQSISKNPVTANALADSGGREVYLTPLLKSQEIEVQGVSMTVLDYRGRMIVSSAAIPPDFDTPQVYESYLATGLIKAKLIQVSAKPTELEVVFPIQYRLTGSVEGGLVLRVPLNSVLAPSSKVESSWIMDKASHAVAGEAPTYEVFEIEIPLDLTSSLNELGLKLAVSSDQQQLLNNLRLLMVGFLLLGAIVMVGLFFFARAIAIMIASPLREFAMAAEEIAATGRPVARLMHHHEDEFGRMAAAFNTMIDRLSLSYAELEQRVAKRTQEVVVINERLRQRELYLRATIDNVPFLFWLKDAECRFLAVNKVFAEACGRNNPDELVGLTDFDVWPAELAEKYRADDLEVIESRQARSREEPMAGWMDEDLMRDGWIETFKKPVVTVKGDLLGTVGFARDVSERRNAEASIREHVEQLNAIFALSADGFISFDGKHCVKYVSAVFSQMTGLNPNEIIGLNEIQLSQRLAELCIPQARFIGIAFLRNMQKLGGGAIHEGKQKIELLAGKGVLEVGLREAPDKTVTQILYLRDITHESEVDRMKSEFLSTAAHELRTPMASIYGFSELLLSQSFSEHEQHDLLSTIYKQSELMISIINELLDLARIEDRRGKDFTMIMVDIIELLTEIIAGYKTPRGRSQPRFEVLPTKLWVSADRKKLIQVFSNVISNAYKYSPKGGEVSIELELPELIEGSNVSKIGISFIDYGLGMSPEQIARVFERFYRADTSGNIPGTGLGMSIVKEIVDLHCGKVSIESSLGKGTKVTIWLPIADQSISQVEHPAVEMPFLGGHI